LTSLLQETKQTISLIPNAAGNFRIHEKSDIHQSKFRSALTQEQPPPAPAEIALPTSFLWNAQNERSPYPVIAPRGQIELYRPDHCLLRIGSSIAKPDADHASTQYLLGITRLRTGVLPLS
jgi:hypothetical protein